MKDSNKTIKIVIAGGGTGGHIYPGIAVADEILSFCNGKNIPVEIYWIGNKKGMDRGLVEKNYVTQGGSITSFYGIPCGKLRRYFSIRNFFDAFKIIAGFFSSLFILSKIKPALLFSKGGFVSVPPCLACRVKKIPYFTHECDFTPGLATRINSKAAKKIFISYEDTKKYFNLSLKEKCIVTGNPVRPVFYKQNIEQGKKFLSFSDDLKKPVLLVLGGSLGALQINRLVVENLTWLKERFIVVHQTGKAFADENPMVMQGTDDSYKPYAFIYSEMPSVIQNADIVLSRSGANSLWECAVSAKPMVLVPLCGSGTRGDQVDNARYFNEKGAAVMLAGDQATSDNLKKALTELLSEKKRAEYAQACRNLCGNELPATKIAEILIGEINDFNS